MSGYTLNEPQCRLLAAFAASRARGAGALVPSSDRVAMASKLAARGYLRAVYAGWAITEAGLAALAETTAKAGAS